MRMNMEFAVALFCFSMAGLTIVTIEEGSEQQKKAQAVQPHQQPSPPSTHSDCIQICGQEAKFKYLNILEAKR